MALVTIEYDDCSGPKLPAQMGVALKGLRPGAPLCVLVHGYILANPWERDCPDTHIFAPPPDNTANLGWPQRLGLAHDGGLALSFRWNARGTLRAAYRQAAPAAVGLARLLAALGQIAPDHPVTLIGHSLGARVVMRALESLPARSVSNVILLHAVIPRSEAERAAQSPAAQGCEILNVTSHGNILFDIGAGILVGGGLNGLFRCGLRAALPHWINLQIDRAPTRAALAALGHHLAPPDRLICHYGAYTRPGILDVYAALIKGALKPSLLRLKIAHARTKTELTAPVQLELH